MAEFANILSARNFCKSGTHQWGEWKYVAENSCTEQSICNRCGGTSLRIGTHKWNEWEYVNEKLCDQTRSCLRCRDEETKVLHVWSEWEYVSENNCTQRQSCVRCGASHPNTRIEHPQWVITGEDQYTGTRVVKGPGPSYDAAIYEEEGTIYVTYMQCTRCNETNRSES
jgi:hypothetical protein